jgi:hypothetical protein
MFIVAVAAVADVDVADVLFDNKGNNDYHKPFAAAFHNNLNNQLSNIDSFDNLNTYKGFADNNFAFESTYKYKFYIIN